MVEQNNSTKATCMVVLVFWRACTRQDGFQSIECTEQNQTKTKSNSRVLTFKDLTHLTIHNIRHLCKQITAQYDIVQIICKK